LPSIHHRFATTAKEHIVDQSSTSIAFYTEVSMGTTVNAFTHYSLSVIATNTIRETFDYVVAASVGNESVSHIWFTESKTANAILISV
jgi:hypothetical protein